MATNPDTVKVTVYLSPELRRRIEHEAELQHRSLSSQIVYTLERQYPARDDEAVL